jgi:hypothetical protein
MVSHKTLGGLEISIGGGGLRFKRRPGRFALCVGHQLKGEPGPHNGGRYDKEFQARFINASRSCRTGGTGAKAPRTVR